MNANIKISINGGASIEDTLRDAIALANKLDLWVEFDFNGVTCHAHKNGNCDDFLKNFKEACEKKDGHKYAFSPSIY